MLNIVLFQPEIPPNTGNIMRLCANTGCALHLIEPLGFDLEEKKLRRAGLDYRDFADVQVHSCFETFTAANPNSRIIAVTTKGMALYHEVQYRPGDALVFGPETRGLPGEVLDALPPEQRIRIPMRSESRSLNLSNAAALVSYEALRQLQFPNLA